MMAEQSQAMGNLITVSDNQDLQLGLGLRYYHSDVHARIELQF